MNSPLEFSELLSMIGFTTIPQRNEITAQGLLTMDDLADLSKDELNAILKRISIQTAGVMSMRK